MRDQSFLDALQTILDEFKIPKSSYSLNAGYKEEAIVLNKNKRSWEVCNFEKGKKHDIVEFTNLEAISYVFLSRLASSDEQEEYMSQMLFTLAFCNDILEDFKDAMDSENISYSINEDTDIASVFISRRFFKFWEVYHLEGGCKANVKVFENAVDACLEAIHRGCENASKDKEFTAGVIDNFWTINALN